MSAVIKPKQQTTITPRMMTLSPYELYLEQIKGVAEAIRVKSRGLSYIPAQFGGLKGQLSSLNSDSVVQMINFENNA